MEPLTCVNSFMTKLKKTKNVLKKKFLNAFLIRFFNTKECISVRMYISSSLFHYLEYVFTYSISLMYFKHKVFTRVNQKKIKSS